MRRWFARPAPAVPVTAALPKVIVAADTMQASEAWRLPLEIGYFVDHALNVAMYREEELPAAAVLAFNLHTYLGECGNGGHAQYANNVPDRDAWRDAAEGLEALGLLKEAKIVQDFIAFAAQHPQRFARHYDETDPYFHELDDRQAALGGSAPAERRLSDWLRTCDWLEIVDVSFSSVRLRERITDHPDAERRRAAIVHTIPDHMLASLKAYATARGWPFR